MRSKTYLVVGVGIAAIAILLLSHGSGSSVLVPQVLAQNNGCSNATLAGSYAALYEGYIHSSPAESPGLPGGGYLPDAIVVVVRFDGNGGILPSSGGALNVGTAEFFFGVRDGTYSLNPDCTGDLTFFGTQGVPFRNRIHVTGNGEEYRFLRLQNPGGPGITQFGTARRMDLVP